MMLLWNNIFLSASFVPLNQESQQFNQQNFLQLHFEDKHPSNVDYLQPTIIIKMYFEYDKQLKWVQAFKFRLLTDKIEILCAFFSFF